MNPNPIQIKVYNKIKEILWESCVSLLDDAANNDEMENFIDNIASTMALSSDSSRAIVYIKLSNNKLKWNHKSRWSPYGGREVKEAFDVHHTNREPLCAVAFNRNGYIYQYWYKTNGTIGCRKWIVSQL